MLEVADEYQEIQDLLTRHATLSATSTDLQQHQARCDTASEATHAELAVCVKWASDALLSLNNQVCGGWLRSAHARPCLPACSQISGFS